MVEVVFETGETYTVPTGVTVHQAAKQLLEEEEPVGETRTVLEIIDALGNAANHGEHTSSAYTILLDDEPVPPDTQLSGGSCKLGIRRQ